VLSRKRLSSDVPRLDGAGEPGPADGPGSPCALTAGQLRRGVLRRGGLTCLQRLAYALGARRRPRYLLADRQAEALELRDVDILDADVGNRVQGRVLRVGGVNRFLGDAGERLGLLLVLRVVVQGGTGAGRDRGPAVLGRDQVVILLGGGPGHVLPGGAGVG